MRNPALQLTKIGGILLLMGALGMGANQASADFTDTFSGTTLNAAWTQNIPQAGPAFTVNNGLTVSIDAASAYDEWVSPTDFAPRIEMAPPAGDFTMTGNLDSVTNDADGTPVEGKNYHSVLMISFGQYDKIMYGLYRSNTTVRMERSGSGYYSDTITAPPVALQIVKTGNVYHFLYKAAGDANFKPYTDDSGNAYTMVSSKPIETVGIMQKSWEAVALNAKWTGFSILSGTSSIQTVSGTVATTGGGPAKLDVELIDAGGKVADRSLVNADGSFALVAEPGTYSVQLVGSDLMSSAADATKTGITVPATGSVTGVAFTGIQVAPDLNSATDTKFQTNFDGTAIDTTHFAVDIPKAGATVTQDNGLKINVPDGEFDYWVGTDHSPKVRIPTPPGDWITSTRLEAYDPDGNVIEGGNYNVYLAFSFGPTDVYLFTLSLSDVKLEALRTGGTDDKVIDIPGVPVWVQVKKTGNDYAFFWKAAAADPWQPFAGDDGVQEIIHETKNPNDIQLGVKTWGTGPAVNATFGDFNVEGASLPTITSVGGTVTTNGPPPNKANVQVKKPDGTVVSVVPIAADGTYSTAVAEGTYTFTVLGNIVVAGQAAASQSVNVVKGGPAVNFTVNYYPDLNPATDIVFDDNFKDGIDAAWAQEIPAAGPTITTDSDGLHIKTNDVRSFDYWVGVADSPRLVMPNPVGDFIMTGKLESVNDADGNPVENHNYHSALYIYFGGTDAMFWGAYTANETMRLERSGAGYFNTATTPTPVWLQIKRYGNTYSFYSTDDPNSGWTQLVDDNGDPWTLTEANPPSKIGIVQKTWEAVFVDALWSDLKVETANIAAPTCTPGDVNGDAAINVSDAVLTLKAAVNLVTLTADQIKAADVNGDGAINVADAVKTLKHAVSLPDATWPTACAG